MKANSGGRTVAKCETHVGERDDSKEDKKSVGLRLRQALSECVFMGGCRKI